MAHIKYYFIRDKNKYEQAWDYNKKLTKWVSLITSWFWITDVTTISSNTRKCQKGLNFYISLFGLACVAAQFFANSYVNDYQVYFKILAAIILFILIMFPLYRLMFKLVSYFCLYYILLYVMFEPVFYISVLDLPIQVILYVLPGLIYNKKYLEKVLKYESFTLEKVEINRYSCYYLYYKYFFKVDILKKEERLKHELSKL